MARKLYKTKAGIISLSLGLVVPGKKEKVYLSFSGGVRVPTFIPSTLIVSSPEVQKVLEAHPFFNQKLVLAKTFKENKVEPTQGKGKQETPKKQSPEPKSNQVKKVGQVKNVQGAITYLIKLGADAEQLDTFEDVVAIAKKMNIEFTQLKEE